MHQWHITLAFGIVVGYGIRYLQERIRRARSRAEVYKGRWPVALIFLLGAFDVGCLPAPCARIVRVVTHRTYKVRRAPPKIEQAEIVRALREEPASIESIEELFPTVPDSTPTEVYVAPGCLR